MISEVDTNLKWIVLGTSKSGIILTSKGNKQGVLPKGSYLTIDEQTNNSGKVINSTKFILRVEDSTQKETFSPSPLIVDMDLDPLLEDGLCKNAITAVRVKDYSKRTDGLVDVIRPSLIARRSNQKEINEALEVKDGPKIFPATIFESVNSKLLDDNQNEIYAKLPENIYWHQIQITGKTGSGKTVASKYLAQYFVENKINISDNVDDSIEGAVLAINVKDIDFLTMNQPSTFNNDIKKEWSLLGLEQKGLSNYNIYFNGSDDSKILYNQGVDKDFCTKITIDIKELEPNAILGVVQSLTELQQQNLPDIFRYWQQVEAVNESDYFSFINWFEKCIDEENYFNTLDITGRKNGKNLHPGTASNILQKLQTASKYFNTRDDNGIQHKSLNADDILVPGKMSVINVSHDPEFGSIVLRDLLNRILQNKRDGKSNVPVLIIIDEVHQFYKSSSSKDALGALDTICRVGRSSKIGVIFSTQNEDDLPKGVSSVVNTKLYFKTDSIKKNNFGVSQREIQSLKAGFGVGMIHGMPNLNVFKFPLSCSGVPKL